VTLCSKPLLLSLAVYLLFLSPHPGFAYSVQTHEQLIDLEWKPAIEPLLLARYPNLTPQQLLEAHAFAYGGCAIQDLGYYPFGNQFFSNLTHYVRTGDFVRSLLRNVRTADELAFAIGALSHYVGDTTGHSLAVNPSVAKEFPGLARRYGSSVTYEESPHSHVRVEFAFDIDQLSKRRFAPSRYLKHVGLQVATDLLGRAFFETYGLQLSDVLGSHHERPAFGSYRFSVRSFLPRIAYAETVLHRHRMPPDTGDPGFLQFERALAQSDLENGWDQYRSKAGIGTYTLAGLIFILPPIGPLADLKIRGPEAATEEFYVKSVNLATASIHRILADVAAADAQAILADLPNRDLDTGKPTISGTYRLTDETYAQLLALITQPSAAPIPIGLLHDVQAFYADPYGRNAVKRNRAKWARVQSGLAILPQRPTVPQP
jgi:hypothetical protein